jgi:hypothetical protein
VAFGAWRASYPEPPNQSIYAPDPFIDPDDFFGDLLEEKELQTLRTAIEETLSDVKVYRFGSIKVTYIVVGMTEDGRLGGLQTTAVET